jgi:hypothetical protein
VGHTGTGPEQVALDRSGTLSSQGHHSLLEVLHFWALGSLSSPGSLVPKSCPHMLWQAGNIALTSQSHQRLAKSWVEQAIHCPMTPVSPDSQSGCRAPTTRCSRTSGAWAYR